MTWSGWKNKENYHVLVNQFHGNLHAKTFGCGKIKSVHRDLKWCFTALWGLKRLSPHDASKHHFSPLKTYLILLQPRVLKWKFPWNCFSNMWQFSFIFHPPQVIFIHYKSRIATAIHSLQWIKMTNSGLKGSIKLCHFINPYPVNLFKFSPSWSSVPTTSSGWKWLIFV